MYYGNHEHIAVFLAQFNCTLLLDIYCGKKNGSHNSQNMHGESDK